MKRVFPFAVSISIFILISGAYAQLAKSKRVNALASPFQTKIYRGELTSLSGLPNGPVFVAGYAVEEGSDYNKYRPVLWRILNSTATVMALRSPYRIDECFWLDERTGWAYATGKGIYKTTDGGRTWVKQPYDPTENVFFLDKTHGWYFDSDRLMGIEGTKTAKLASIDVKYVTHIKQLQFVTFDTGWLLDVEDGRFRFQKSYDGGKSWDPVEGPFTEVDSFQFLNEKDGYVSTPEGLYATVNGGSSWDLALDIEEHELIDRIFFLSPNVGWTYGNRICMTMNAGHEWKCQKRPDDLDGDSIKGFLFTDESNGWLLVDNKLFSTNDGGKIWKRKNLSYGKIIF